MGVKDEDGGVRELVGSGGERRRGETDRLIETTLFMGKWGTFP